MTRFLLAAAVLLAAVVPASAAPPTDVAELFPPGTLAYAELHNPAELGGVVPKMLPDLFALLGSERPQGGDGGGGAGA